MHHALDLLAPAVLRLDRGDPPAPPARIARPTGLPRLAPGNARRAPSPVYYPGLRPLSKGAGHVATVLAACGVGLVLAPPSAAGRRARQASPVASRTA